MQGDKYPGPFGVDCHTFSPGRLRLKLGEHLHVEVHGIDEIELKVECIWNFEVDSVVKIADLVCRSVGTRSSDCPRPKMHGGERNLVEYV